MFFSLDKFLVNFFISQYLKALDHKYYNYFYSLQCQIHYNFSKHMNIGYKLITYLGI